MTIFDTQCITFSQMNLIFNSRIYYRRLTTWTRSYLLSRYLGVGTAEAQFERLYQETLDIGRMLQLIFGRQIAEEYSQLLSQYAIIFHQLIEGQLAGDINAVENNLERLRQNVKNRADFLESINPFWSAEGYERLFSEYIRLMIETANAISSGNFTKDIELYDIIINLTTEMGDVFAEGIYAYITSGRGSGSGDKPNDVPCITAEQMNDIYIIRMFWFEMAVWIRNYMLRRYTSTGDSEEAFARLLQVPLKYVRAMKVFFPDIDVEGYMQYFTEFLQLIDEFITANIEGDEQELSRITQELYANADKRAEFIATVSPLWSVEEWRSILYVNLRTTIEESTTFLTKDYAKNIDVFTRLLDQAEISSTFLAKSIFDQITA